MSGQRVSHSLALDACVGGEQAIPVRDRAALAGCPSLLNRPVGGSTLCMIFSQMSSGKTGQLIQEGEDGQKDASAWTVWPYGGILMRLSGRGLSA